MLSHENADIVIDVVEVIHEFTDEDNEAEEDEEEEGTREEAQKTLIEGLVGLFSLLRVLGYTDSVALLSSRIPSWSCSWTISLASMNQRSLINRVYSISLVSIQGYFPSS